MTIVNRVSAFVEFWYYQYILVTALYMLESWERKIFNCFLIAFLAMASYTAYIFLPGHILMLGHFFEYLVGATGGGVLPRTDAQPGSTV